MEFRGAPLRRKHLRRDQSRRDTSKGREQEGPEQDPVQGVEIGEGRNSVFPERQCVASRGAAPERYGVGDVATAALGKAAWAADGRAGSWGSVLGSQEGTYRTAGLSSCWASLLICTWHP